MLIQYKIMTEDSFWSQSVESLFDQIPIPYNYENHIVGNRYANQEFNEAQNVEIYESDQSDNDEHLQDMNDNPEPTEANGETGEVQQREAEEDSRTERVTNCIFKTSLSSYRKALVKTTQSNHQLQWLRVLINQVYDVKSKNQGMFPKLNYMARQLHIEEAVNKKWRKDVENILQSKKKKISPKRYRQLAVDIEKMEKCIEETNFWSCFRLYWGEFTQSSKYRNCKSNLEQFTKEFDRKIASQEAIEEMQKKLPDLKRKKVSNSKALKQPEPIYQETSHTE